MTNSIRVLPGEQEFTNTLRKMPLDTRMKCLRQLFDRMQDPKLWELPMPGEKDLATALAAFGHNREKFDENMNRIALKSYSSKELLDELQRREQD